MSGLAVGLIGIGAIMLFCCRVFIENDDPSKRMIGYMLMIFGVSLFLTGACLLIFIGKKKVKENRNTINESKEKFNRLIEEHKDDDDYNRFLLSINNGEDNELEELFHKLKIEKLLLVSEEDGKFFLRLTYIHSFKKKETNNMIMILGYEDDKLVVTINDKKIIYDEFNQEEVRKLIIDRFSPLVGKREVYGDERVEIHQLSKKMLIAFNVIFGFFAIVLIIGGMVLLIYEKEIVGGIVFFAMALIFLSLATLLNIASKNERFVYENGFFYQYNLFNRAKKVSAHEVKKFCVTGGVNGILAGCFLDEEDYVLLNVNFSASALKGMEIYDLLNTFNIEIVDLGSVAIKKKKKNK